MTTSTLKPPGFLPVVFSISRDQSVNHNRSWHTRISWGGGGLQSISTRSPENPPFRYKDKKLEQPKRGDKKGDKRGDIKWDDIERDGGWQP